MTPESQQKDHDLLTEIHTKVDAILIQTQKTNGRVTKLEDWRNYIAGGLSLLCMIGLPMLWSLLNDVKVDSEMLRAHVAATVINSNK